MKSRPFVGEMAVSQDVRLLSILDLVGDSLTNVTMYQDTHRKFLKTPLHVTVPESIFSGCTVQVATGGYLSDQGLNFWHNKPYRVPTPPS